MNGFFKRGLAVFLVAAMVLTLCDGMYFGEKNSDAIASETEAYCISSGRPVYASSGENEDYVTDGDATTRWIGDTDTDYDWIYIDLGKVADLEYIYIQWEASYATGYKIQLSDDADTWTDVYSTGITESDDTEEQAITITTTITNEYGLADDNTENRMVEAEWTSIDGATYTVYIDEEDSDHYAEAQDGYLFSSHGPSSGNFTLTEGEHTIIIVAYIDGEEVGRGTTTVTIPAYGVEVEEEEETTTEEGYDPLIQTIDLTEILTEEEDRQARYVRIYMVTRALSAYGFSIYEFQVWGTNGKVAAPVDYGDNLALDKDVDCSGTQDEWWMYDDDGNMLESSYDGVKPENAVDGDTSTYFNSYQSTDDQWLSVDLGDTYTIGRVIIDYATNAAKIYDVQISSDNENWTTIHRYQKGYPSLEDNFTCYYTNVRYVRVYIYQHVSSGSGTAINELEVYEYIEGDSQENETIEDLPTRQIVNNSNGSGSYVTGEIKKELNMLPVFVNSDNVDVPIDSNGWWTSSMINTFGNTANAIPYKTTYSKKGLGVTMTSAGWVEDRDVGDLGAGYSCETGIDFYILPDDYDGSSGYDRVEDYGDYSVDLGLCDDDGLQMVTTIVKGSPYLYTTFEENDIIYIKSSTITEVFDEDGTILSSSGESVTTDHIGFTSVDDENTTSGTEASYFVLNVPEGTKFKAINAGSSYVIQITFPSTDENYMSIGCMTSTSQFETMYEHGYAFVTDTEVEYTYDHSNSIVTTVYNVTTEVKRDGFSDVTMQGFFPHQWKNSDDTSVPNAVYPSIRGDIQAVYSNSLTTTQQFGGLIPTFALPDSDYMDTSEMKEYINTVVTQLGTDPNADAYWQGKAIHPLAMAILMADQIGETEMRDEMLESLEKIMVDWFTYDGDDDSCYFIYNQDWGTIYYPESAYGANASISDHHFTYGYMVFGAAVLSSYNTDFYNEYKDMVELLVRDYANPDDEDDMFPSFRNFDQYSGHSWAGGYGDNDSGNNQESAGEALFSWVGLYLWGEVSGDESYIDAGAYGFTTEMEAILQYWFNYDDDVWLEKYSEMFKGTGQIYGSSYSYGTYFGGQPVYVYGIQWLPVSEYLTYYGMDQEKAAEIYQGLWDETEYAIQAVYDTRDLLVAEAEEEGATEDEIQEIIDEYDETAENYVTPDNGWQHITWPFLSQTDSASAYTLFEDNVSDVQQEDRGNTLWFISAMDQLGTRTTDYVVTGTTISGSVYYNSTTDTYVGEVWNPTTTEQEVSVVESSSGDTVGTVTISSQGLVSFEIDTEEEFSYSQADKPTINATDLTSGDTVTDISGDVTFDDTQVIELVTTLEDATIYYTVDGTAPTEDSNVYTGTFVVSSDCTVKAMVVAEGYINSSYASVNITIDGDDIYGSDNLALNRTATASSEDDNASNVTDGSLTTFWQGDAEDDEYIQVDLGSVKTINTVKIYWETAFASSYEIQISLDGENWDTVATETGEEGYVTTSFEAVNARYVRMQGIERATVYGYNIYEFEVYGANQADAPTIDPESGTYDTEQTVTLSTTVKGAEIKYTTDGSEPTVDSDTYTGSFTVSSTTSVKAVTYRYGMILSDITESVIVISGTLGLNYTSAEVAVGNTLQLEPLTEEDSMSYESSDSSIATVDSDGLVTGVAAGEAIITATNGDGESTTCTITVVEAVPVTAVEIRPSEITIKTDKSDILTAVVTPSDTTDDLTETWSSSDESVVTVDEDGTITGISEGTATVYCTVAGITAECAVTVGPRATVSEMIIDSAYNLALGKNAYISTIYSGEGSQDTVVLTDGSLTGDYVSTDWDDSRTYEYVIVDLGANYNTESIDAVAIQFVNESTYGESYTVSFSSDGITYVDVAVFDGITYSDTDDGLVTLSLEDYSELIATTRYVKVTIDGHKSWGFQIREVAVLSTTATAEVVEVEQCDPPASIDVSCESPLSLTVTINPDDGQEDYTYTILIDGEVVASEVEAGTYTFDATSGSHTVQVVSNYDGLTSESVFATVDVDDGSLRDYVDTSRNLALGGTVEVYDIYEDEGSQDTSVLTDGDLEGEKVETTWGEDTAYVIVTLPTSVSAENIEEVFVQYSNSITYALDYTISFSADGETWEVVADVTDETYASPVETAVDVSEYTQDTVTYVKIEFTKCAGVYGYQMYEIAVIGTADAYMPEEPYGLALTSTEDGSITVTFSGADNGQTYRIYIDGTITAMNLASAGTYTYSGYSDGTHIVTVTSVLNDIESDGVSASIVLPYESDEETTAEDEETSESEETTTEESETDAESETTAEESTTTAEELTTTEEETEASSTDAATENEETTSVTSETIVEETTAEEITTEEITTEETSTKPDSPFGLVQYDSDLYSFAWGAMDADYFNIYIDGVLIASSDYYAYQLTSEEIGELTSGSHTLYITAVVDGIESDPSDSITFTVTGITVTVDGESTEIAEGAVYTLPESSDEAAVGYYDESTGTLYRAGDEFTVTDDMTFETLTLSVSTTTGASIKVDTTLNKDYAGAIRFQANVSISNSDLLQGSDLLTVGILLGTLEDYQADGDLTLESANAVNIVNSEGQYNETGSEFSFYATITNIRSPFYAQKYVARTYVIIAYSDGTTETLYANENSTEGRSVASVASLIVSNNYGVYTTAEAIELIDYFASFDED